MPVDYSKWDAFELSDDSDIEVHPNVDKRSFIRAKQNQIHQQRFERKHRITTLKYERVINDGLLARIDALLKALNSHHAEVEGKTDASDVDEVVFDSLTDVNSDGSLGEDQPPSAPAGVHSKEEQPSYSKMMGALVDQVKSEIEKKKTQGQDRYMEYIKEVGSHYKKVQGLQKDLSVELSRLEKEEGSKITSESIHTGFNSSHVAKSAPSSTAAVVKTEPELLNPARPRSITKSPSNGSEADIEDAGGEPAPGEDEEEIEVAPVARLFGKIAFNHDNLDHYNKSEQFIESHREVLAEKHLDGLLAEAFDAQTKAKNNEEDGYAWQCVHQALSLQYCLQLGKQLLLQLGEDAVEDGVKIFFQGMRNADPKARKPFLDDVNKTYAGVRTRAAEFVAKERTRAAEPAAEARFQLQLHAFGPSINIVTPPPMDKCQSDEERASREIFETFPPGLQRALESKNLAEINKVLGKMSMSEAEEVVEHMSNSGMLSMEKGVIDATTDEGMRQIEEIERAHKMPGQSEGEGEGGKVAEIEEMD